MSAAVRAGAYLHHIGLCSPDPAALAAFYAEAMDMDAADRGEGVWLCTGPGRLMVFTPGGAGGLAFAAFACRDADSLAGVRAQAEAVAELLPAPTDLLDEPFAVRDPDDNLVVFGLARPPPHRNGLRGPLQHLTLATLDVPAIERFYTTALGFLVSDRVRTGDGALATSFMRSNHEHHTLACFRSKRQGIDHHSYEAGDWAEIKHWCDRMGARRIPLMWGPGRHGPGNNLFAFITDPDGNWIEISAELEVVHDRPVKEWPHEEHTLNLWGRGILRS